ncbi:MAG TPA: hypothetical protein PLH57_04275 [Oligoflexia bacterium]|nr:hypothetical protein [Oligoflexia bacterium]
MLSKITAMFFMLWVYFCSTVAAQTVSVPILRGTAPPVATELPKPKQRIVEKRRIPVQPTSAPLGAEGSSEQELVGELQSAREAAKAKVEQLNQLNPLVKPPEQEMQTTDEAIAPGVAGSVQTAIENSPQLKARVLALVEATRSERFVRASHAIINSPNLRWFYGFVIASFFIFIWIRRRVLAGTDRFLVRIFLKAGFGGLFVVALVALAFACFGQAAFDVLSVLWAFSLR